jgi:hypothetical protein
VAKARDNLLLTKIAQAHQADSTCSKDPPLQINDLVMLSTRNRRREYKKKGEKRTAKFFPCRDGPYHIVGAHPEASTYTLDVPTNTNPVFHVSELKLHISNDPNLFPGRELPQPGPMVTEDGLQEHLVEEIVDSR